MVLHLDAQRSEVCPIADPGEHQQLRRLDGTRGEHDFPMRPHDDGVVLGPGFHGHRALAVEDYASCLGARQHEQIRAFQCRIQHGAGGGLTPASADGELTQCHPLGVSAGQIRASRKPQLRERIEEGEIERIRPRDIADIDGAAAAVKHGRSEVRVILALAEVRQHFAKAPAPGPRVRPGVVVARVPPEIDHAVDERRAAETSAARQRHPATIELRLRDGLEAPVE